MSIADPTPFQLVYISEMAPGTVEAVSAIEAVSRRKNRAAGISGALLFDGARFCQLLEGAEPEVRGLMERIGVDPRHRSVSVTAAGRFGLPRLTTHWHLARCDGPALEPLVSAPWAADEVALALFMSALAAATVV